jgi:predicted phosphodiesterase
MFQKKTKEDNSMILVMGDTHAPYMHKDAIAFLKAIKAKYKPTRVIHIGDEIDAHSFNFHEHNPDLAAPGDELKMAIKQLTPIYEMFPNADVLESNHGSMVFRKAVSGGLPKAVIKSYREILQAPKGWNWHEDLTIMMPNGLPLYFHHSRDAKVLKTSQNLGMSAISGHLHNLMSIEYWATPFSLNFAAQCGCLIDKKSLAFEYCKTTLKKPLLGVLIIDNCRPKIIPMWLDNKGSWIGKLLQD